MRWFHVSLLAAGVAALVIAGVASAKVLNSAGTPACSTNEGQIEAYDPSVGRSCPQKVGVGQELDVSETVQTFNGQLTFTTEHINRCIEWPAVNGSADVLRPEAGIAIKHLYGKTWCRHLASDHYKHLKAPGATLTLNGTIVGIDSTTQGSLVKVAEGTVTALSRASQKSVVVPAGFQLFVPVVGPPQALTRLVPDEQDIQAVGLLTSNAIPIGSAQVRERLTSGAEKAVVVVGQDAAAVQGEIDALKGMTVSALDAEQAQTTPKLILSQAKTIGARTVVVTGSFSVMQPILALAQKLLPPQYSVLFVETPAKTTIVGEPTDPSNSRTATFSFTSDEPDATFRCSIDNAPYTVCTSPQTYSGLAEARHHLSIYAVDRSGRSGTASSYDWTVALPDLVITSLAADSTTVANVGSGTADRFSVTVQVGSGEEYVLDVPNGLAPGAQTTLDFPPYYGPMTATADSDNAVDEADETNNTRSADFTIG
jgi:hypothetical protein